MMNFRLHLTMMLVLALLPATAQHAGNVRYSGNAVNPQTGTVTGDSAPRTGEPDFQNYRFEISGLYNATTAAYVAIFNIVQLGETAEEADQLVSERLDALMEDLGRIGISESDIHIDMISQIAIYEYQVEKKLFSKDNYLEIPKGIELQKNLHITFREGSKLDDILTAAARQEIYDLVKVDYFLENQDEILQELQRQVIAFHKEEIKQYLTLGVRLDTAKVAFNAASMIHFPMDRYRSYQSTSSSTLKGLKDETGVQQVRKPQTMYYQPISTNNFEVVINPLVEEPVVQIAYTLTVRYYFQPPPTVQVQVEQQIIRQKEFLLLTPEGEVKPLTIINEEMP